MNLTTNYSEPWGLFLTNGHVEGHRPRTAMFWIHEAKAVSNEIVQYRVRRWKHGEWAKSTRWIDADQLLKTWRCFDMAGPCPVQISRAKYTLTRKH